MPISEDERAIQINCLLANLRREIETRDRLQQQLCTAITQCLVIREQLKSMGYTGPHYSDAA